MSTGTQEIHVNADAQTESPMEAIRARLAPFVATAALILAVAGVVYGPGFVTIDSVAAQPTQNLSVLASVGAALRDQSPECLVQGC